MPKGARTIAEHRSWHALVWTWLVALLLEDLGPDLLSDELSWSTSSLLLNQGLLCYGVKETKASIGDLL